MMINISHSITEVIKQTNMQIESIIIGAWLNREQGKFK